jgi:electron transfer flavoprotein beta subunit
MYICVCIKQTPDSNSVYVDPINGQVDIERFVQVLNAADACAVEAAVRLKEQVGGSVQVLTLGPRDAEGALRAALAIGADSALRLWNEQASSWNPFQVAAALAGCIKHRPSPMPDLIVCGDSASDWSSGIVGPALAESLGLPQITHVMQIEILAGQDEKAESAESADGAIQLRVRRRLERGYRELLEAETPLLLTVTGDLNEPRYPSLPAHLSALRAEIPVIDPLDFILDSDAAYEDEMTLLEMHVPRPLPKRISAPDSQHSPFERIGEIVSGGATGRKGMVVEGPEEVLAEALVTFLAERGFI